MVTLPRSGRGGGSGAAADGAVAGAGRVGGALIRAVSGANEKRTLVRTRFRNNHSLLPLAPQLRGSF